MGIAMKRKIYLVKAYREGIKFGVIAKSKTTDGQVVLAVKKDADQKYLDAAGEYRNWEIMVATLIGGIKGTAIVVSILIALELVGIESGFREILK